MGTSAQDSSGYGNDAVLSNAEWTSGRAGPGALRFNGGSDAAASRAWISNQEYRVIPAAKRSFSVLLWFSPDVLTNGWRGLIGNAAGSNGWSVALRTSGPGTNEIVFAAPGAASPLHLAGRTLLLPGQWYELAITYDGNEVALFLNGEGLARGNGTISVSEEPIFFGGGVGGYDGFAGRIDEVRAYTKAFIRDDISLKGYWRFDESDGLSARDFSIQNGAAMVSGSGPWAPGKTGGGIDLRNGVVTIPNDSRAVLPPTGLPFSIAFWLYPEAPALGFSEFMSCADGTNSGWRLGLEADEAGETSLRFWSTSSGGTLDLRAPVLLRTQTWSKIEITHNGGVATVYLNGRKVHSDSGAIRAGSAPLVIGMVPGAASFNGALDELKIWGRERSASDAGPVAQVMWETVLWNTGTHLVLEGGGPAGRPLLYSIVDAVVPTNGVLTQIPGTPMVRYAAGNRKGPDAFAYTVSDGEFTSPPTLVIMSVVEPHWLSPEGGSVAPLDGSSPERAWAAGSAEALDAIWKTNNFYDCFFYAPGEYESKGWRFEERATAHVGCKHMGAGFEGTNRTVLKLVDAWSAWADGTLFASHTYSDGFEVHNMVLDCNAENNPKYERGEPIWISIPLTGRAHVQSVKLRWHSGSHPLGAGVGRAQEFSICTTDLASGNTNCISMTSTGDVDTVVLDADADEIVLQLKRRSPGVDFYGVADIEVAGGTVSLPSATIPGDGESRLETNNTIYSILKAVDQDQGTYWASGSEDQVEIRLPLPAGTAVSEIAFNWNCRTINGVGRMGAAASFQIRVRNMATGQYGDVPFFSQPLHASGRQAVFFGAPGAPIAVVTDEVVILLSEKAPTVGFYSLLEVALRNSGHPVPLRIPRALNGVPGYPVMNAVDGDSQTGWVSGTQGMVGAISLTGNNMKFTRLKVIGFGTKALRECFPVYITTPPQPEPVVHQGNIIIEDCIFTEPATNNTDGLTALTLSGAPPHTFTNAIVRNCTVADVRPHFVYSHGFTAKQVENCVVTNCGNGVYFEPDPAGADDVGAVLIRSNRFLNVINGVYLLTHASGQFDSLTCIGNEVVLSGLAGWGFAVCDTCDVGPSGSVTNMTVLNNLVRFADWSLRPSTSSGGLYFSDIQNAVFGNNVIVLGTPNNLRLRSCPSGFIFPPQPKSDCEIDPGSVVLPPPTYPPCLETLPPNYRRAWFGNCDHRGNLLEVRYLDYGLDRPASQQQWP